VLDLHTEDTIKFSTKEDREKYLRSMAPAFDDVEDILPAFEDIQTRK
jgi:hypothetical protein